MSRTVDRTVKRPEKIKNLIEKLGEDKYHWAFNVQQNNFPFWSEAFDYAYKLGLERGKNLKKEKPKSFFEKMHLYFGPDDEQKSSK